MSVISMFKVKNGTIEISAKSQRHLNRLAKYSEAENLESAVTLLENIFTGKEFAYIPEQIVYEICDTLSDLMFVDDYIQALEDTMDYLSVKRKRLAEKKQQVRQELLAYNYQIQNGYRQSYMQKEQRENATDEHWKTDLLRELDLNHRYNQYMNGYENTKDQIYFWLLAEYRRAINLLTK